MLLASKAIDFAAAGALIVAVSADDVGAGAATTARLALPFPVLSDPGGHRAIEPFGVWKEDEQRARPALVALAPDVGEVYRYVGADQVDRAVEDEALVALRALRLRPRPAPAEMHVHTDPQPTANAYPKEQLAPYLRGVRSAANVLLMRTGHEQAARLHQMAERFLASIIPGSR